MVGYWVFGETSRFFVNHTCNNKNYPQTPVLYLFKMTRTIVAAIFVVIVIFIIVCVTPAGFPYTERYAVQRFTFLVSFLFITILNILADFPQFQSIADV